MFNENKVENEILRKFIDEDGKIIALPSKYKVKNEVLKYLAEKFCYDIDYTEKQVNEIIMQWHIFNDYFVLRRELVDNRFLCRTKDGSRYWKGK